MGAMGGGELMPLDKMLEKSAHEERIVVSVRLRPLNAKEIGRNDVSDWECINDNTIIYRSSLSERPMYPTAYSFDRVFRADCPTRQVYEEAAKEVALSVVSGVNASIFAYGQTSSGKTYTMSGITEFTVTDIYDYIEKHQERAFVLRFSAMEIYNEAVRDLLSPDGTPLRLLDDPERGTVVDKLTEETLRDLSHLRELLSVCETQRQIGETSLNEASSRSHQILRLTIESSAREFLGRDNSSTLAASVDFVDLAGSERASQTLSAGTRLKEGCHINRSLLTLGTVIRKLSKGRNGHIPYRDSKLTRILQSSLGGNAKTAIICTISPARSHVEQSRNTLSFANCAKEVSTNAQVNVVMSDKALVKHLQKELERLESELRVHSPKLASYDSMVLLKEKDLQIEKMEKEISELTHQRDIAKARLENLVQSIEDEQASGLLASPLQNTWVDGYPMSDSPSLNDENYADIGIPRFKPSPNLDRCSESSSIKNYLDLPENQVDEFLMKGSASSLFSLNHPSLTGPDSGQENEKIRQVPEEDSEEACKEVRCIETAEPSTNVYVESSAFLPEEGEDMLPLTVTGNEATMDQEIRAPSWKGEREFKNNNTDSTTGTMEQKPQDVQKTIDCLVNSVADAYSSKSLKLTRSRSCRASLMSSLSSSSSGKGEQDENMTPNYSEDFLGRLEGFDRKSSLLHDRVNSAKSFRHESPATEQDISLDELKEHKSWIPVGADVSSIGTYAADLKGADKFQYKSKHVNDQGTAPKANKIEKTEKDVSMDTMQDSSDCPSSWSLEFSRQQRDIIELWQTCNVSLVHRTYFFLLFKGDPADSIYMEVELRRLSFLKEAFCQGSLGKLTMDGDQDLTPASSMKALRREREMLSRQMQRRFSEKERRNLYQAWGIGLNTKQRRVQLVRCLWTDTKDMDHIMESAKLVAKLVGLLEPGQAPKEMFGLSFLPRQPSRRSYSWKK